MAEGPTIKGEKQELKNGLVQITCDADGGKLLAFYNGSKDLQFNVTYEFLEPQLEVLGDTLRQDNKFAVVVYPGETKEMARGSWKAFKKGFSFGAPDKAWQDKQASRVNEQVDAELQAVKELLKANPRADGKYTADYIASVCEATSIPFVDITFAPRAAAISRDWEGPAENFAWKRPAVYCTDPSKRPCLFVGDIEPNDIDQGQLGNCYFLCALACLSEFPERVKACFDLPQNPSLGVYRVRMCKNGWWQAVVIDDLVPTARDVPVYAKNREEPNELWVSMLEKAYAKLHGSYAAIKAGDPAQAMFDFTGAPYERIKDLPFWGDHDAVWKHLAYCDENDHLMSLGTPGSDNTDYSSKGAAAAAAGGGDDLSKRYKDVGLVTGHAFSLIRVKEYKGERLCMIRNPWGNGLEWSGKWSDSDPNWTPDMKKALGFYAGDDGTFWMDFRDVMKWFDGGAISYHLPTYSSVRAAANFEKGAPDLVMQIIVSKGPVDAWLGAHQRDSRGLPSGDKDRKHAALLLAVLKQPDGSDASAKLKTVASSGKGAFMPLRDAFAHATLEPSDKPYYVLVQCHGEDTKSFVLSGYFSDDKNVRVQFLTFKDGAATKFNPPSNFDAALCNQKAAANFQVMTPRTGSKFVDQQGDSVNFAITAPTAARAPAAAASKSAPGVAASKAPAPAAAKAPVKAPAVSKVAGKVKLSVVVLSGRNLVAKDIGGTSDPFVTISLLGADGNPVKDFDEPSTKYIKSNLNPVWGEQFVLDVPAGSSLHFHCWDKDVFGKDDMGFCVVPLRSLGIEPGGPGKMDFFPLTGGDATGDLQLLFTMVT